MKLSAAAILLGAAVAAVVPAVSAESLRGILHIQEEEFFANCEQKTQCTTYGENTCTTIETSDSCPDHQCYWDGSACHFSGGSNGSNRSSKCELGFSNQDCASNEWCQQNSYGQCSTTQNGFCSFFTGSCNNNGPKVCGCNGKTYKNECQAYAEGHNIDCKGSCPCPNDEDDEEEVLKSS